MHDTADRLMYSLLKAVAPEGVVVGYSANILYVEKGKRPANGLAVTFLFDRDLPELNRDFQQVAVPNNAEGNTVTVDGVTGPKTWTVRQAGVAKALTYQVEAWTTDFKIARKLLDGVALGLRRGYRTGEDQRLYFLRQLASRDRSDRARGFYSFQWDFELHGWIIPTTTEEVPSIVEIEVETELLTVEPTAPVEEPEPEPEPEPGPDPEPEPGPPM